MLTIQLPGHFAMASSLKIINIAILTNALAALRAARRRRDFTALFPRFPLKNQYATPVTPHRGIIEDTFKCSTSACRFSRNKLYCSLNR